MAKAKQRTYHDYPKYDGLRSGIKVSWYYYKNRADAETAAKAARFNAEIQQSLGYDFGYCAPGSIYEVGPDRNMPDKLGMFEVCIP